MFGKTFGKFNTLTLNIPPKPFSIVDFTTILIGDLENPLANIKIFHIIFWQDPSFS